MEAPVDLDLVRELTAIASEHALLDLEVGQCCIITVVHQVSLDTPVDPEGSFLENTVTATFGVVESERG